MISTKSDSVFSINFTRWGPLMAVAFVISMWPPWLCGYKAYYYAILVLGALYFGARLCFFIGEKCGSGQNNRMKFIVEAFTLMILVGFLAYLWWFATIFLVWDRFDLNMIIKYEFAKKHGLPNESGSSHIDKLLVAYLHIAMILSAFTAIAYIITAISLVRDAMTKSSSDETLTFKKGKVSLGFGIFFLMTAALALFPACILYYLRTEHFNLIWTFSCLSCFSSIGSAFPYFFTCMAERQRCTKYYGIVIAVEIMMPIVWMIFHGYAFATMEIYIASKEFFPIRGLWVEDKMAILYYSFLISSALSCMAYATIAISFAWHALKKNRHENRCET